MVDIETYNLKKIGPGHIAYQRIRDNKPSEVRDALVNDINNKRENTKLVFNLIIGLIIAVAINSSFDRVTLSVAYVVYISLMLATYCIYFYLRLEEYNVSIKLVKTATFSQQFPSYTEQSIIIERILGSYFFKYVMITLFNSIVGFTIIQSIEGVFDYEPAPTSSTLIKIIIVMFLLFMLYIYYNAVHTIVLEHKLRTEWGKFMSGLIDLEKLLNIIPNKVNYLQISSYRINKEKEEVKRIINEIETSEVVTLDDFYGILLNLLKLLLKNNFKEVK